MTTVALAGPLTEAETLLTAADLIDRWGLCRDNYEGADESLCPAGAVAVALGYEANVWSAPTEAWEETGAYDLGFAALYALVESIGRWDMGPDDDWDGEALANYVAFWLVDVSPSAELVLQQMRDAAASLSSPAEQIGASA
ncbi:hypothetical protein AB0J63_26845 [Streptosporangium canum]|uniref:DUF6197 family protein n=1 Tax=Streptosporangium canum TaxID=324952 RepID=UPI003435B098